MLRWRQINHIITTANHTLTNHERDISTGCPEIIATL